MKRKIVTLLMALTMVLSMVGCAGKDEAPTATEETSTSAVEESNDAETAEETLFEGRTITVAFLNVETADAIQAQIDAFCAKYGCTIDVEIITGDSDENANTMFMRAATGNLPDIFRLPTGMATIGNLDPATNLVDLSEYDFMDNITDAYKDIASDSEGHIYSIPIEASNVAGVFYNKTVFNELGLTVPTTWAEFMDTCKWIRDNTDMDPVSSPFENAAGKQILHLAQYYYVLKEDAEFNEKYVSQEINLHDSAAYVRGPEKLYEIYQNDLQNDDPLSTTLEDSARAICDGTAAFVISRSKFMTSVEAVAPDKINDIGFFPLPDESEEDLGVAVWLPCSWYMSQTASDKELALKFLEFLTTQEAINAYCEIVSPVGAFMLNNVTTPDNVSAAVMEAQEWAAKSSSPVMEYFIDFKGRNLPDILAMCGTGELEPSEAIAMIEEDYKLNAEQNGIW